MYMSSSSVLTSLLHLVSSRLYRGRGFVVQTDTGAHRELVRSCVSGPQKLISVSHPQMRVSEVRSSALNVVLRDG